MLLKDKKPRFKVLLENGEMVFAPCVWDCYSAAAAEICEFKAVLLAGTLQQLDSRERPISL